MGIICAAIPGRCYGSLQGPGVRVDAIAQIALPQLIPDGFDGLEFRGASGQLNERDVVRNLELGSVMPAGAVEDRGDLHLFGELFPRLLSCPFIASVLATGINQALCSPVPGQLAPNR